MTATDDTKRPAIDAACFDFSQLVGRDVTLFSDQFPGKPLKSRVVLASDREISVDRGTSAGFLDSLVSNQKIIIRMDYRGQPLSVPAVLRRTEGGRCRILLGRTVVPLSRRRFTRISLACPVKLAVVPVSTFSREKLSRLRWLETVTVNFSSAGSLIDFSSCLSRPTYLFLHIDMHQFSFPSLVLAQVLYSLSRDSGSFHIGVEFITREVQEKHFSAPTLRQLPPVVFGYGEKDREQLNEHILAWKQETDTSTH
jgi:hypothetical protein